MGCGFIRQDGACSGIGFRGLKGERGRAGGVVLGQSPWSPVCTCTETVIQKKAEILKIDAVVL